VFRVGGLATPGLPSFVLACTGQGGRMRASVGGLEALDRCPRGSGALADDAHATEGRGI
jgi:hypothetical protein